MERLCPFPPVSDCLFHAQQKLFDVVAMNSVPDVIERTHLGLHELHVVLIDVGPGISLGFFKIFLVQVEHFRR